MRHHSNTVYGGSTVAQLYISALGNHPDRLAIVGDQVQFTYRELEQKSYQFARLLQEKGLQRQDAIAFLVGNRAEAIVGIIAAQILGLKSVSLHPMASEDDHCFVLQDANIKALIVDSSRFTGRGLAIKNRALIPMVLSLDDSDIGPGLVAQADAMSDEALAVGDDPTEITKLSYTGGTTGRSKGILHSHRTVVTMVLYMMATYEWPEHVRYLVTTPISHAAGGLLLPVFLRGGTVYLMEKYDAPTFLSMVQEHRINFSFLVPTQIYGLIDYEDTKRHDLSSLELILYGASPIAPSRLQEAIKKIGPVFGQLYGQAEAPMKITYLSKKDHDFSRPHLFRSCGRVVAGNQVKLLDSDCREVPLGEVGELCVRGPLIMDGYLNRPEENEKVFKGDWLHTGDMARKDDQGYLYIVDRVKDMIISGGFNVYPSEVENCLANHPAVAMSAVIGVPDEKWGEKVTAVVVLKSGMHSTETEIIQYVTDQKGVVNAPKAVMFEAELPLTALGKIDKKAIRTRFWSDRDRQVG
ncbi:MAG TPA: acyl-CoA synthetase [Alcaligenaceae bacterium]|nr:acyl-CoA synthetase [Alcaligenaceae bacterium]